MLKKIAAIIVLIAGGILFIVLGFSGLKEIRSFPQTKALKMVIDWTELSQAKFAEKADIQKRTVERILAGVIERPSAQIVMRICIGLSLPVELSLRLMERSGNSLRSFQQDMAYMKLLFFAGYYSIEQCNRLLEYQGIHTI